MADVALAMPLDSLFTNPNPDVPRSKSILSRFAIPLSKHARNMFEVAIEPEDPFRVYGPGDTVKGHVLVKQLMYAPRMPILYLFASTICFVCIPSSLPLPTCHL